MNTEEAVVSTMNSPEMTMSDTNDAKMSLPSDLTIFVIASVCVLCAAFFSAFEGLKVDFHRTGKEYQSGRHQRNVFYFSLLVASSFKFVMMMMELRYFSSETCAESHVCSFLRFSPDITFLAAYSVMIMFLTQLGYDVSGVNSEAPKKTFITCLVLCIVVFFPCLIFEPDDDPNVYLFRFLGVVHLLLLLIIIYSGIAVSRHIPSGITIGQRILSRLIALCVVCGYSTLVGTVLYLIVMKSVWRLGYPKERLLLFDGVVVIFKDVLPMFLILYFTSKRSYSSAPPPTRLPGTKQVPMSTFLSSLPGNTGRSSLGGASVSSSRHSYTKIDNADDNVI